MADVFADAINALNIAVGELAFDLRPDDRRRDGIRLIQSGLDVLWLDAATTTTLEVA
jgi:hypothetical protein